VRSDLDRGVPCPLGLVRTRSLKPMDLGLNHQVLAYGYDLTVDPGGTGIDLEVLVYDPNWPGRDDVAVRVAVRPEIGDSTVSYLDGERPVRGFFRTGYRAADPSAAVRGSLPSSGSGSSPVATGRDGSEIQSDQDPA
jgi:hypothetical protein